MGNYISNATDLQNGNAVKSIEVRIVEIPFFFICACVYTVHTPQLEGSLVIFISLLSNIMIWKKMLFF